MISIAEIDNLVDTLMSKKPVSRAFEIPALQIYSRNTLVRLGTRLVYADFPRGAYELEKLVLELCDRAMVAGGYDRQKGLEIIKSQKNDPDTDLGLLTSVLERLGIKWSVLFAVWYRSPVIRFNVNGYFKSLWPLKVRSFVEELNKGKDSPREIYEKARTLTPEFLRISEVARAETTPRLPRCFELLFSSSLSPYREVQNLAKLVERLYRLAERSGDPLVRYMLLEPIADLKTSLYSLKTVIDSGHTFGCYPLLRKILTSFSYAILLHSFYMHAWEHDVMDERGGGNEHEGTDRDFRESLSEYAANFPSEWKLIQSYGPFTLIRNIDPVSEAESVLPVQDLRTFISIREKILGDGYVIQLRDKFLIELLDFLATQPADVFDVIDVNTGNGEIWMEYKKLSEIVHDPVFIDFPPFSSTLEYLGIVHHLRKVRYHLERVLHNYSKLMRRKKRRKR